LVHFAIAEDRNVACSEELGMKVVRGAPVYDRRVPLAPQYTRQTTQRINKQSDSDCRKLSGLGGPNRPGKGKIVGGTGDFKKAKGTFNEQDSVNFLALPSASGTLDSDVTLTLTFDDE